MPGLTNRATSAGSSAAKGLISTVTPAATSAPARRSQSAAKSLIVPIQCEYYALEGVTELFDTLARIRRHHNPGLTIEGLLLTMYDERTKLSALVPRADVDALFRIARSHDRSVSAEVRSAIAEHVVDNAGSPSQASAPAAASTSSAACRSWASSRASQSGANSSSRFRITWDRVVPSRAACALAR